MAVAVTGFFDGVHLGHKHLISTLLSEASRLGEQSLALTFWPHPRVLLQDDARGLRILSSQAEKRSELLAMGVDEVKVLPFTREFASLTAVEYLKMLSSDLGVCEIVVGYDTRIGCDRKGPEELSLLASSLGMSCVKTSALSLDGCPDQTISSTKIRRALQEGDVLLAAEMLGRHYALDGVVVSGNRIGRTLGFPTANMQVCEPLKLVPGNGVYLVEVETVGLRRYGMTNIGFRPTVGGSSSVSIETNIFDFDQMIYGCEMRLSFLAKIRDERRFASLSELAAQLAADKSECLLIAGKD